MLFLSFNHGSARGSLCISFVRRRICINDAVCVGQEKTKDPENGSWLASNLGTFPNTESKVGKRQHYSDGVFLRSYALCHFDELRIKMVKEGGRVYDKPGISSCICNSVVFYNYPNGLV